MAAVVTRIPSENPHFVVLEVTVFGSAMPAHRVTIACAALANGFDLEGYVERLKADAEERQAAWLSAQAILAGLALHE